MHPILSQRARLLLYLAVWLALGVAIAGLLVQTAALSWTEGLALAVPLAVLYAFACLATFYVCKAVPLRGGSTGALLLTHVAAAVVTSAAWVAVAAGWSRALDTVLPQIAERAGGGALLLFAVGVLLALLATAMHYVVIALEESREAETRGLALKVLAREAELKALRAQIDPHFLFNSLNSISALTTTDPAGARHMCVLLGEFLRSSLRLGAQDRITLADEVSLIERFLAIERVRFGGRLTVAVAAEPEAALCLVPPLLLQPLVENAVRHGIAGLVEGGTIRVAARRSGNRVRVTIENPSDPDRPASRGVGLGLANVKNRLLTEFGADAHVEVRTGGSTFRVEIAMPAREAVASRAPDAVAGVTGASDR